MIEWVRSREILVCRFKVGLDCLSNCGSIADMRFCAAWLSFLVKLTVC